MFAAGASKISAMSESATTALLVVDIQNMLTDALDPQRREAFLRIVADLLERARAEGVPIVHVQHQDEELVPGTVGWELASGVAPRNGEPVVAKRYRDAFRETELADLLAHRHVGHVVVCGMQTEFCVDATVREADRRGYRVTLVEDGTATFPVKGASEAQIAAQVHRVARGQVAAIVPAAELFVKDAVTR